MDFFQRQDKARSQTFRLSVLFFLGMIVTALFVHAIVAFVAYVFHGSHDIYDENYISFWTFLFYNPRLFWTDMIVTIVFITIVAMLNICFLNSEGPDGIARSLGGKLVERGTRDPREKRLYNVVEEIAIASGTPIPRVYFLSSEPSINACAIGTSAENAAVCATLGSLDYLTRDELQGVIAHEFSHIVNNDVRINTRLSGCLFGLELIAIIAAFCFRFFGAASYGVASSTARSRNDKEGGAGVAVLALVVFAMLVAGALFIVGRVGVFFGNLCRFAISRQREYLADASAVAFTRNPNGIAGALKKIGAIGSHVSNNNAIQASHMFFGSVFSAGFWGSLFQTHPDLIDRIRAIDPTFDGVYPRNIQKNDWSSYESNESIGVATQPYAGSGVRRGGRRRAATSQLSNFASETVSVGGSDASVQVSPRGTSVYVDSSGASSNLGFSPESVYGSMFEPVAPSNDPGTPDRKLSVFASVLQEIPPELDAFLVDLDSARAAFYTILLSRDTGECVVQRDILLRDESTLINKLSVSWTMIHGLEDSTRLIVARKATPLLKTMSSAAYSKFRKTVLDLCNADGVLSIFEYTILASTIREMDLYYRLSREPKIAYQTTESVRQFFVVVLSYLAREGALNPGDELSAFNAGLESLGIAAEILPESQCTLSNFSGSLNSLSVAAPLVKRDVLRAFYRCVANDGVLSESEAAMMSAITAALGAPAPIWQDWSK